MGSEIQEEGVICIPMVDSCRCMAETNTILKSNHPSIKNKYFVLMNGKVKKKKKKALWYTVTSNFQSLLSLGMSRRVGLEIPVFYSFADSPGNQPPSLGDLYKSPEEL